MNAESVMDNVRDGSGGGGGRGFLSDLENPDSLLVICRISCYVDVLLPYGTCSSTYCLYIRYGEYYIRIL